MDPRGVDGAASSPTDPPNPESDPAAAAMDARLPGDLLRAVLQRLLPADLARAACVCRAWHAVASDRVMLEAVFRAPWGVRRVIGEPVTRAFWRAASLGRFALSHTVRRGDTVPGIALKYSVQVTDVKRFNNMMSDHGIYSRERLLIPISNPEILLGSTCYIEMDHNAKREVAVFYPEGRPGGKTESLAITVSAERRSRKIVESVRRSLHVDDGTAAYYLSITEGDPRAAMVEFSEDLRWEQQRAGH
ncbi:F-box protein At1g55000-like [Phragmites australis]|uniref:F-box protein At1g55000-like n=1 Tax=Phragmites australis TaxID=29695 RepID=UPI002D78ADD1|nr:F-box protein At1g55000-like [Phragmites australis]